MARSPRMVSPEDELHESVQPNLKPTGQTLKPDIDTTSDTDGGERVARERLKKASIDPLPRQIYEADLFMDAENDRLAAQQEESNSNGDDLADSESEDERGRISKKRSYDEVKGGEMHQDSAGGVSMAAASPRQGHQRKKSRDAKSHDHGDSGSDPESPTEESILRIHERGSSHVDDSAPSVLVEAPIEEGRRSLDDETRSLRRKRSRDQFDKEHASALKVSEESNGHMTASGSEAIEDEVSKHSGVSKRTPDEREPKRHRDSSQENYPKSVPEDDSGVAKVSRRHFPCSS